MTTATLLSGPPDVNKNLRRVTTLGVHDPVSYITLASGRRVMIVRDVELPRARAAGRAEAVHAYEDFPPTVDGAAGPLSGDREVRASQATAECLVRHGVTRVTADRSLPLLVADEVRARGIEVVCDRQMGVRERRMKDRAEVEAMRAAHGIAESAVRAACELIARAEAAGDGTLLDPTRPGEPLTSERVMALITVHLAERGAVSDGHIVAGGADGGDCHEHGRGVLRTGELIIVDVFPRHTASGYHGDCTRTVVHGRVPAEAARMHAAVAEAKAAAFAATRVGATGEDVHRAVMRVMASHGYPMGFPPAGAPKGFCSMPHGTGHGLGLDLKEPPLLDLGGPELLDGDAVTIEPGLYALGFGGVRLEDLVIVRPGGVENLSTLPEGLAWA